MVGTLTETELLRSPFARRLGQASWFLSAWAYLIAAYCIFGSLFTLWTFAGTHPSGLELLVGTHEGLTAGLVVGVIGLVISFPGLRHGPGLPRSCFCEASDPVGESHPASCCGRARAAGDGLAFTLAWWGGLPAETTTRSWCAV